MNSTWINHNPKEFVAGDIICDREKQEFLRLVLYVDDVALWVTGLVHCAFTENMNPHPIFPMYFKDIDAKVWPELIKLGNIKDYTEFISKVQYEIKDNINNIDGYFK